MAHSELGGRTAARPRYWLLGVLSLGHLITDMAQGALPALLPLVKQIFALSYTQLSLLVLVSNVTSSVVQPVFGYLADRRAANFLLPLGVLTAGLGLAAIGWLQDYKWLLLVVALSGLGVAAYHPEGSRLANLAGGQRKGGSMAIFSIGGNLGFGLGAVFMAALLAAGGREAIPYFAVPALLVAPLLFVVGRWVERSLPLPTAGPAMPAGSEQARLTMFGVLIAFIVLRSWVHAGLSTYVPLYYTYLGGDPHWAGYFVSAFLLAGAAGTLLGGPLTDVYGAPRVMLTSMLTVMPIVYLFTLSGRGFTAVMLLVLAGMAVVSTFATTIVLGQQLLPGRKGLAAGFTIGFGVGTGGIGVIILGMVADKWGLPAVFKALLLLAAVGALLAFWLERQSRKVDLAVDAR